MAEEPLVILVDDNDKVIGQLGKLAAHQQGVLHRAFSILVLRQQAGQWQTLLQQRAATKYHCGGLWTNTCCSHPYPGEATIAAGQRRLQEEVGLQLALTELGHFKYTAHFANGLIEHEFDHVLVAVVDDCEPRLNPEEVQAVSWRDIDELMHDIDASPSRYTPWLKPALSIVTQAIMQERVR